jgi:hypothetical protein
MQFVDRFRWDVYAGRTTMDNLNCHWWKLRYPPPPSTPSSTKDTLR